MVLSPIYSSQLNSTELKRHFVQSVQSKSEILSTDYRLD